MRPLIPIPNNPPATPPAATYDEATERNRVVTVKKKVRSPKRDVQQELGNIVEQWVKDGAKLKAGRLDLPKTAESNYKLYQKKLSAGDHDWGDARRALIQTYGAYCSYCQAPIYSHLAVEHKLAKNTFPEQAFAWNNFLLACPSCNSIKGIKPNQGTVPVFPPSTQDTIQYINNHYLWPNVDWNQLPAPIPFPLQFRLMWGSFNSKTNEFVGTSEVTRTEEEELYKQYQMNLLKVDRAYYVAEDVRNKRFFAVVIGVNPSQAIPQGVREAAAMMIDLVSLNRIVKVKDASKSVDRRLLSRTSVWFQAIAVTRQIAEAASNNSLKADLLPPVLQQAVISIRATGYWGVWMQVLGRHNVVLQKMIRDCMTGTAARDWIF